MDRNRGWNNKYNGSVGFNKFRNNRQDNFDQGTGQPTGGGTRGGRNGDMGYDARRGQDRRYDTGRGRYDAGTNGDADRGRGRGRGRGRYDNRNTDAGLGLGLGLGRGNYNRDQQKSEDDDLISFYNQIHIKKQIVGFIYNTLDISKFKYKLLEFENEMPLLKKEKFFVSPNLNGINGL